MPVKINKYQTVEEVQNALARELSTVIEQSKNTPLFLLLSGGSSLMILPIIQQYLERIPTSTFQLTIAMVDERFDAAESNFVRLRKDYQEFYNFMTSKGAKFIDTSPKLKDQYEMAKWYEAVVRRETSDVRRKNGKIVALLGMGPDGHIAGILPNPDEQQKKFYETFLDTKRMVVGYDATRKNKFSKRFTLTFPALLHADQIFAYVVGEEKLSALNQILHDNPPLHRCPGYFLKITQQPVVLFTTI